MSSLPPLPIEVDMMRAGIYPTIPLRHRMIMDALYERVRVLTEQVQDLLSNADADADANKRKPPGKQLTEKDIVIVHPDVHGVGSECPICLQGFCSDRHGPVVALKSCGHSFHHTCISKWVLCAPTCPVCRKDV